MKPNPGVDNLKPGELGEPPTDRKIFFVISQLDRGGTETHLLRLLRSFGQEDPTPVVYTLTPEGSLAEAYRDSGIKLLESPYGIDGSIARVLTVLNLARALRAHSPDIVHMYLPAAYILGSLASLFGRPAIRVMSRRGLPSYRRRRFLAGVAEKMIRRSTHFFLANSEAVAATLMMEGVSKHQIGIIHNGVKLPTIHPLVSDKPLSVAGVFTILSVANLIPYKGHRDILSALFLLKDRLPDPWRLICVGRDDGIKRELQGFASELGLSGNVIFAGEVEDPDPFYRRASVFLLASHEEGFSNAVLEGMSYGLPVIVTDAGGNREAITQGVSGILVPTSQPQALANALLSLVDDRQLGASLGAAARMAVEEHYSIDACVLRYRDFYRAVLREKRLPKSVRLLASEER